MNDVAGWVLKGLIVAGAVAAGGACWAIGWDEPTDLLDQNGPRHPAHDDVPRLVHDQRHPYQGDQASLVADEVSFDNFTRRDEAVRHGWPFGWAQPSCGRPKARPPTPAAVLRGAGERPPVHPVPVTGPARSPFPPGSFDRQDDSDDAAFYDSPRFVTHLDEPAIAAVSAHFAELAVTGDVLDLMSSWVSHLSTSPRSRTVLGLNAGEPTANPMATCAVVHDLNADPVLPFADSSFDAVLNCVSVDYLTRPVEVYAEVARVLRPGGVSVCTFSNRCSPTKAVRGWLTTDDPTHCALVAQYHRTAGGFDEPVAEQRLDGRRSDPLWAAWARRP